MVKITTIVCAIIMLVIPVIGASTSNNPDSSKNTHTFCKGIVCGEIEDYTLSLIAKLIYLLKGEPSTLRISRATIVIMQEPDKISLRLTNPIKQYCMDYYGNITIQFYASIATIHLDTEEHNNCSHILCWGIFGLMYVEQN